MQSPMQAAQPMRRAAVFMADSSATLSVTQVPRVVAGGIIFHPTTQRAAGNEMGRCSAPCICVAEGTMISASGAVDFDSSRTLAFGEDLRSRGQFNLPAVASTGLSVRRTAVYMYESVCVVLCRGRSRGKQTALLRVHSIRWCAAGGAARVAPQLPKVLPPPGSLDGKSTR